MVIPDITYLNDACNIFVVKGITTFLQFFKTLKAFVMIVWLMCILMIWWIMGLWQNLDFWWVWFFIYWMDKGESVCQWLSTWKLWFWTPLNGHALRKYIQLLPHQFAHNIPSMWTKVYCILLFIWENTNLKTSVFWTIISTYVINRWIWLR